MHSILNSLERLLSESEDADYFIGFSEKVKRLALNDLLGDASTDFVDAIIESIKQVTMFVWSTGHFHDHLFAHFC